MAYNPSFTDVTAAISIAANATSSGVCTSVGGAATFTVQLTGTFVATVQIQVTKDGSTWVNLTGSNMLMNAATGAYMASGNMTVVGIYQADITGFAGARVITTAWTSGTVTGTAGISQTPALVSIEGVPAVTVSSGAITATLASTTVTASTPATPTASAVTTAATTNATSTKASAGTLYGLSLSNPTATAVYFKLYNLAAAPTVGTSVPVITIPLPANSNVYQEFGPMGLRFGTGISWAATGAITDADTTAAVAGAKVFLSYI